MEGAKLYSIGDGRTDIERAKSRIEYLEGLVKEAGLERYAQVKEENIQLRTDKAVLEERIVQMNKRFELEVEGRVRNVKAQAEELRKENSGLRSGLAGTQGRVAAAQQREEKQYSRAEKLNTDVDTLRTILDSVNSSLSNTKELLVKAEAQNTILLENNRMLKDQVEMLTEHKEMLERLIGLVENINISGAIPEEFIDIINKNKNYLVNSTVNRGVVLDREDAKSKINMIIDYINQGEKTSKELAEKYGCNSTAALSSRINTIKKSWFCVINDYVMCSNIITDELRNKHKDKYNDILEILEEIK